MGFRHHNNVDKEAWYQTQSRNPDVEDQKDFRCYSFVCKSAVVSRVVVVQTKSEQGNGHESDKPNRRNHDSAALAMIVVREWIRYGLVPVYSDNKKEIQRRQNQAMWPL